MIACVLFICCLFLLVGSLYLTLRLRFVQLRLFGQIFRILKQSFSHQPDGHAIHPHRALFTSMSTTLGISTIVSPVIAICLGGPGALLGFLVVSVFGSAATYAEVSLSLQHRRMRQGGILGGPMQYLRQLLSPRAAQVYAISCMLLMAAWSAAQANQLSALLVNWHIPTHYSGILLALVVIVLLIGGIKRIGAFSAKLVPVMFVLYFGSCLYIICANYTQIIPSLALVFHSAFSPVAVATGAAVGGLVSALRWGVFKGIQSSEAGIGTQSISHSMADEKQEGDQATLAMFSTYMAGGVAFISGLVTLVTGTWNNPELPIGIGMMAAAFELHFGFAGMIIIAFSTLLFAFGTILGNSYNGSQCYGFLARGKRLWLYYGLTALLIILGSIGEVTTVWSVIDIFLAGLALPHMYALIMWARAGTAVKVANG